MNQATLVNGGTTLQTKTLRGKKLSANTGTGHQGDDSHKDSAIIRVLGHRVA